jgi:hypothetical protein
MKLFDVNMAAQGSCGKYKNKSNCLSLHIFDQTARLLGVLKIHVVNESPNQVMKAKLRLICCSN